MNLAFSQEDLDFKEEVRVFLKSEYPSKIREKQEKGLPLERDDVIKWQKLFAKKVGLLLIGQKNMGELVGLQPKNIFFKMN